MSPYLALLQVRFTRPGRHRRGRELLPHDFTLTPVRFRTLRRYVSVALSVGLPRLGVTQHPCPVELGLSSPIRLRSSRRPPGLLDPRSV